MRARSSARSRALLRRLRAVAPAALLAACGGGSGAPADAPEPARASEEEWRMLAAPRPEPLEGAARVSVGEFRLLHTPTWASGAPIDPELAMAELVSAGLLRRRDVHFVERRRFSAAAARERQGIPRPPGAPAAGVSPGAELLVNVAWASLGLDSTYLDVRVVEAGSGAVVHGGRAALPQGADPVSAARRVVGTVTELLDAAGRLPSWSDPVPGAAPRSHRPSGVTPEATAAFLRGLSAEEEWAWEGARRGFQAALRLSPGFVEAESALSRAARLRAGETLGAN